MFVADKALYLAQCMDLPSSHTKPLINLPPSEYVSLSDIQVCFTSTSGTSSNKKTAVFRRWAQRTMVHACNERGLQLPLLIVPLYTCLGSAASSSAKNNNVTIF